MNQLTESSGKTLVVIPAHNEAQSVSDVIASIGQHVVLPIVVVDDASTDDTALVAAESGATVIPLINRLGAWGATQTGIRYALANRFTTVVTMDADGQHDPSFIMEMLFACESESADVCIGSWPLRGSALRKLAWGILRAVSGLKTTDLTSGYRVYNERPLRILAGWRATFLEYQDVGVLALLLKKEMKIIDIQTPMCGRQHGHSRVFHSWLMVAFYMCHSVLIALTKRRIKNSSRAKRRPGI